MFRHTLICHDTLRTSIKPNFPRKIQMDKINLLSDRIYICGGFNGSECLGHAECYDPRANQWTMLTPMRSRRSGVGVIAYRYMRT